MHIPKYLGVVISACIALIFLLCLFMLIATWSGSDDSTKYILASCILSSAGIGTIAWLIMETDYRESVLVFVIPQVIAISMLIWALVPTNPYGYYILLRVILFFICWFLAACIYHMADNDSPWVVVLAICAVVYNPLFRIHLNREIWSVINVATIVIMIKVIIILTPFLIYPVKDIADANYKADAK